MSNLNDILAAGTRAHQAGQLAEAEQAYRQILSADPRHPAALHQLGILALQAGQFPVAIELISRAIQVDRVQGPFYANLGEALRLAGRPAEAARAYQQALTINPGNSTLHMLLGSILHDMGRQDEALAALEQARRLAPQDPRVLSKLGMVLEHLHRFAEAEVCFRGVVELSDSAEARFRLASVLQSQGRANEAIGEYEAAIEHEPAHVETHNNLGTIRHGRDELDAAERHFTACLTVNPQFAPAVINLGLVRQSQQRDDEAAELYARAAELDPRLAAAWHALGAVRHKQGRAEEARQYFQRALEVDPGHAEAHLGLAFIYQKERRLNLAVAHCEQATRLRPEWAVAHNNLCVSWAAQGRHDEAITAARQAVALKPDFGKAHSNLAVSLQAIGLLDEAIAEHRRAVELEPEASGLHSNLLYALNYHPGYDAQSIFAEHRAWGVRHADLLTVAAAPHDIDRTLGRRLRIGYVSPHLCEHAVNFFTQPILQSHDRQWFDVLCYFDDDRPDDTSGLLQRTVTLWRDIYGQSDEEVAAQIRADRIDILIDLTGHIGGGNRMQLFARKPAPIQVTYLGYQNTTGMQAMDYRLTDAYSDPPGVTEALHTERLVRLPESYFCYRPSDNAPPIGLLPADANGYVTFGSVNAFPKVTPQVLATWAEILRCVPTAKLVVRADMTPSLEKRLFETFAAEGISPERLELVNRLPRPQYLQLISSLDVALDPFPFNGHTTTCDSLWQGVPVVTLSGNSYVTRFGGSGHALLGLTDLITHSREEYVEAAVALANDRERLRQYRRTLRARVAASPLLDFAGFTRRLEDVYREMWADYCRANQEPPGKAEG